MKNVTKSKFISDSAHGGKEASLGRAVECRNQLEQELGKPRTDWVVVGNNPRNKSGVIGVCRAVKKYKGKDGTIYLNEVYQVSSRWKRKEGANVRLHQEVWGVGRISESVCNPSEQRGRDVWEGGSEQVG